MYLLSSYSAPLLARPSIASNPNNWSSSFNSAPSCSACHAMATGSFAPDSVRVSSTASSARVGINGTNGRYYWRYRQGSQASSVFTSPQQIGSLSAGVNRLDFCVVEITRPGQSTRTWNCGEFEIARNTRPAVSLSQSDLSLTTGQSQSITVSASDDLPGLSYSASSNSSAVQVSGSGPSFTIRAANNGNATLSFTVTDSDNESTTREMSVTVGGGVAVSSGGQTDQSNSGGSNNTVVADASTGSCVDTAPVGDGWGWNGSSSCRVESDGLSSGNSSSNTCIDTDPVDDGWGWNGSTSCQVEGGSTGSTSNSTSISSSTGSGVCIDTW